MAARRVALLVKAILIFKIDCEVYVAFPLEAVFDTYQPTCIRSRNVVLREFNSDILRRTAAVESKHLFARVTAIDTAASECKDYECAYKSPSLSTHRSSRKWKIN